MCYSEHMTNLENTHRADVKTYNVCLFYGFFEYLNSFHIYDRTAADSEWQNKLNDYRKYVRTVKA